MAENEIAATKAEELSIEMKEVAIGVGSREHAVDSLYSNSVSFVATTFDLRFVFGQIRPDSSGKLVNEQGVSVVMSWEHAKALVDALRKMVDEHEADFGPVRYKKLSGPS